MAVQQFYPGALVCARGRTWVVQNESRPDWLVLRPLSGADDEEVELSPELEIVSQEQFELPDPKDNGAYLSASLLYDAMRLQLKNGAGPFRSFASLNFEPRAYQLVPLLMALRQETVRLLIADDVGIGKTIEAGLILRELYDRGDLKSAAVLCPPHLADQWTTELKERFAIDAKMLTSTSARKLEAQVPYGKTVFEEFPFLVISMDYIKSDRNRNALQNRAPDLIIVDEAHACTKIGTGKQQRYELLKKITDDKDRHMLLLTATPHSGNEEGFFNLLSLLSRDFLNLREEAESTEPGIREYFRKILAKYMVQRRREDIREWNEEGSFRSVIFPKRDEALDVTYKLSGEWLSFLDDVNAYCRELVERGEVGGKYTMIWYVALALLRCVSSSPAAAVQALSNRLNGEVNVAPDAEYVANLNDDSDEDLAFDDAVPGVQTDHIELKKLINKAALLNEKGNDPKLALLIAQLKQFKKEGFNPVVFCRYIATAEYVAEKLAKEKLFAKVPIECISGAIMPDDRKVRVDELGKKEGFKILVATDCLSEGINLQDYFNAVIQYDLAWNPSRHDQRIGRVDRFGQKSAIVKNVMIYGEDNPVDGFILDVILRKSKTIRNQLGVAVPVPDDEDSIRKLLVTTALFSKRVKESKGQTDLFADMQFDQQFYADEQVKKKPKKRRDTQDKVKQSSGTIFAQRSIHPDEIAKLLRKEQQAIGSHEDLEYFCCETAAMLGFPLQKTGRADVFKIMTNMVQDPVLSRRFIDEGIYDEKIVDFDLTHRASPFVKILSEAAVEQALDDGTEENKHTGPKIRRCALAETSDVENKTFIFLLRIRYRMSMTYRNKQVGMLMAEEVRPLSFGNMNKMQGQILPEADAERLLRVVCKTNPSKLLCEREINNALNFYKENYVGVIKNFTDQRAQELREEHLLFKEYSCGGKVSDVKVCDPIDLVGVFVLLPQIDD